MEQFITFIMHHWPLSLAFLVVLILLILEESRGALLGAPRISPQEATRLLNHENAVVVDVREATAYDSGHILGAINVPQNKIENELPQLEKLKDKPIIVVCASGQESLKAANKLRKPGVKVHVLAGGLNAWRNAGLPLVKS
ncbi:MAG: rhodanese-like domain-containing protein [Gammaproteobacteria bacterium]